MRTMLQRFGAFFVGLLAATGFALGVAPAGDDHGPGEKCIEYHAPLCPVSGEEANLSVCVAADDGPVFFCCRGCVAKYQAEPAKFAEKVAAQRKAVATLPKVQKTCPVSGKPIDKDVAAEIKGETIHFCCKDCIAEYRKDPAKYKGKLANSYEYLKPALCPVTGEAANLTVSADTPDGPLFFCCKGCVKKYEGDPGKYKVGAIEQRRTLAALPRIQVTDPVNGKPVDPGISLEKDGRAVRFSSEESKAAYQQDPGKYKAKLESSYTWQTICPVMHEEIDPEVFADTTSGQRVYFCCQSCIKDFFAEPAKMSDELAKQGYRIPPEQIRKKS